MDATTNENVARGTSPPAPVLLPNAEQPLSAIVESGANRVARLLDDVLDAAFIQSGDFELALHPFDVRASVESCLGMIVEEAGGKSLDLSFRAEPDVPSIIVGDSRRIEQVLLALLHGALERTEKGGIGVELSSQPRGDLFELHFRVRDTGRGVPARILRGGLSDEPVVQAQQVEPGDAMAIVSLSICRHLVEMMDGELRVEQGGVEAGPDAGTTFDFTILTQVMHAPVAVAPRTLEGMRVLVVASDACSRCRRSSGARHRAPPTSPTRLHSCRPDSRSTSPSSSTGARPSTAWRFRSPSGLCAHLPSFRSCSSPPRRPALRRRAPPIAGLCRRR